MPTVSSRSMVHRHTLQCLGVQVLYPVEFQGSWEVTATLKNVSFPFGMSVVNKDVPGATKSSMIAALPDVGAGMDTSVKYTAKFMLAGESCVPDRCATTLSD